MKEYRVLGLNQLFDLNQMHREPTREDRLLDLFFTNKPNLVRESFPYHSRSIRVIWISEVWEKT